MALVRRALVLAVLLPLVAARGASATVIAGGNLTTQTWNPAGSPYEVMGDITVVAGATLTIGAGTVVRFAGSDAQGSGADAARVEVIVNGTLDVNGTSGSPVVFEALGAPSLMSWYGIRVLAGTTACDLSGLRVRHASTAILHQAPGGVLSLANVDLDDCNTDLHTLDGGAIAIAGTLRASRIVGPLSIPSGARLEHNGGPAGTVSVSLTLAPGSTYAAAVRGTSDSDRLFVTGTISLGGTLELDVGGCTLTAGQSAVLMINDDTDAVSGFFTSHPEGTLVPITPPLALRMQYAMGTGNDVGVLAETVAGVPPAAGVGSAAMVTVTPNPSRGDLRFRIAAAIGAAGERLEVLDLSGRRLWSVSLPASGAAEVSWDGRDLHGRSVSPGVYLARLAGGSRASRTCRFVRLP